MEAVLLEVKSLVSVFFSLNMNTNKLFPNDNPDAW